MGGWAGKPPLISYVRAFVIKQTLQYLKLSPLSRGMNPMDMNLGHLRDREGQGEAWRIVVHGVAENRT